MTQNNSPGCTRFALLVAFIGGCFAFLCANASLSASDSPPFCGSCHVMEEAVWTHSRSIHAKQACNECHIPHDGAARMLSYKARLGLNDIMANALSGVAGNIEAGPGMKDVIQANCVRCHYATVREVNMTVKPYCTECHRSVPHMNRMPVDKRRAADV
jgi:cytochrome c nitrite reductase small subunit